MCTTKHITIADLIPRLEAALLIEPPFGLFLTESAEPINFYISPAKNEEEKKANDLLKKSILKFWGNITFTSASYEEHLIRLQYSANSNLLSHDFFFASYIIDCIEKEKLNNLEHYRVNPSIFTNDVEVMDIMLGTKKWSQAVRKCQSSNDEASDFSSNEDAPIPKTVKAYLNSIYTRAEDLQILNYISKHNMYDFVKGQLLWKEMAERGTLRDRSWQSLKERYRKRILPIIDSFTEIKDTLRQKFKTSSGETINESKKNKSSYKREEDELILKFITDNRRFRETKGQAMWIQMSSTAELKHRSWHSLKNRFLRHIIPNIGQFRLSPEVQRRLVSENDKGNTRQTSWKRIKVPVHRRRNRDKSDRYKDVSDSESFDDDDDDIPTSRESSPEVVAATTSTRTPHKRKLFASSPSLFKRTPVVVLESCSIDDNEKKQAEIPSSELSPLNGDAKHDERGNERENEEFTVQTDEERSDGEISVQTDGEISVQTDVEVTVHTDEGSDGEVTDRSVVDENSPSRSTIRDEAKVTPSKKSLTVITRKKRGLWFNDPPTTPVDSQVDAQMVLRSKLRRKKIQKRRLNI